MENTGSTPDIDFMTLATESKFLQPPTRTTKKERDSKFIYKIHNSFERKRREYDKQWECDKSGLLKMMNNSLVATSTHLRKLFLDKPKLNKIVVKPSLPKRTASTKNLPVHHMPHTRSTLKKMETKEADSSSDLIHKYLSLDAVEKKPRSMFSPSPKPLPHLYRRAEATLPLLQVSSLDDLDTAMAVPAFKPGKNLSATLYPKGYRTKEHEEDRIGEDMPGVYLPDFISTTAFLSKTETRKHFKSKSFFEAKSIPFYRFSVENNIIIKLKRFHGRLK